MKNNFETEVNSNLKQRNSVYKNSSFINNSDTEGKKFNKMLTERLSQHALIFRKKPTDNKSYY